MIGVIVAMGLLQTIGVLFYFLFLSREDLLYRWAGIFVPLSGVVLATTWVSFFTRNMVFSALSGYTMLTLLQTGFVLIPHFYRIKEGKGLFCPECGSRVQRRWKVCPHCGYDLWQVLERPEVEIEVIKGKKKEKITEEVPVTAATVSVPHLIVKEGSDRGKIYLLNREVINIGRDASNDIALSDPFISSKHCRIRKENNQFILVDLGSSNGTRVNGKEIQRTILKDGDIIEIGNTTLHLTWKQ
ncbi:MAG: FHA domain-containing protein [bacterium JZ-2024 1]